MQVRSKKFNIKFHVWKKKIFLAFLIRLFFSLINVVNKPDHYLLLITVIQV